MKIRGSTVIVVLVAFFLIICMAYIVRPYQTEAPGKKDREAARSDTERTLPVWVNPQDVVSIEWDGKRTSWLLQRTGQTDGEEANGWSLNGKPAAESDAGRLLSQMNSLMAKGAGNKRPAASLKNETIDSTVTIKNGSNADETVYLIAAEPAADDILWIIPSGASFAYPVFVKDMELLEKSVDRLKTSPSPE